MYVLVTGTAGFIGSHLAEALLARGDRVVGVDEFTDFYDPAVKEDNLSALKGRQGFELIRGRLLDVDLPSLLREVDVVFHLAAQAGVTPSWGANFDAYLERNVASTQRLLEAAKASPGSRIVFASSSSVYGNVERYPTREQDQTRPHSPYGVTKLACEHLCRLYGDNWSVPTVVLRYFTVYGPRQRPDMAVHRLVEAALTGESFPLFTAGSTVRDLTFVSDVVDANLAVARRDTAPGTTVNIAGGSAVSLNDLIALVGEVTGRVIEVDRHPDRAGDVDRTGGDVSRAARLLDWGPKVPLRHGIEAQIAWHLNRRALSGEVPTLQFDADQTT